MHYKNILLIDDDDDDQEIFQAALGQVSATVFCSTESSACRALQKLQSKELAPDVIFLDLNMPVMNGEQFLVEIKRDDVLRHIPVIIFSTSSYPETIKHTKELGAHTFITKPDRFDDLTAILRSLIAA